MTTTPRPFSPAFDPANAGRIAVLCGDTIYTWANEDPRPNDKVWLSTMPKRAHVHPDPRTMAGLFNWALDSNIENVLILGAQFPEDDSAYYTKWAQLANVEDLKANVNGTIHELASKSVGAGLTLTGITAYPKHRHGQTTVWAPDAHVWGISSLLPARASHYSNEERACMLASAFALASYTLGTRLRYSPSYTGTSILRGLYGDRDLPVPSAETRKLVQDHRAVPLGWVRERDAKMFGGTVKVWAYDRNWSHITAARVVPVGDPEQVYEYVPRRPGLYLLSAWAPGNWGSFPGPFDNHGHELFGIWAWEPQVRAALDAGWFVHIHDGYVWHNTIDLRSWQERLWAARRELSRLVATHSDNPAPAMARALVKQVGVATIGRLNPTKGHRLMSTAQARAEGHKIESVGTDYRGRFTGTVTVEADLTAEAWSRPEMWSTIISSTCERVLAGGLWKYAKPDDVLGAYVDNFYTLAPIPALRGQDPEKAGGWHEEYAGVEIPASIAFGGNLEALVRAVARAAKEPKKEAAA